MEQVTKKMKDVPPVAVTAHQRRRTYSGAAAAGDVLGDVPSIQFAISRSRLSNFRVTRSSAAW